MTGIHNGFCTWCNKCVPYWGEPNYGHLEGCRGIVETEGSEGIVSDAVKAQFDPHAQYVLENVQRRAERIARELHHLKSVAEWLLAEERWKCSRYVDYWVSNVLPTTRRYDAEFLRREREQNQQLRADLAAAEQKIAAVRDRHKKVRGDGWRSNTDEWYCGWCLTGNGPEAMPWPCETAELVYTAEELA